MRQRLLVPRAPEYCFQNDREKACEVRKFVDAVFARCCHVSRILKECANDSSSLKPSPPILFFRTIVTTIEKFENLLTRCFHVPQNDCDNGWNVRKTVYPVLAWWCHALRIFKVCTNDSSSLKSPPSSTVFQNGYNIDWKARKSVDTVLRRSKNFQSIRKRSKLPKITRVLFSKWL